jgi:hypothetical protein
VWTERNIASTGYRMTTRNRFPSQTGRILLSVGLLVITACDDTSAPAGETPGVEFTYAGALRGHFHAVGPASDAFNPDRSFAVAFRSAAGELQLCAFQTGVNGLGDFLLLNVGVVNAPGEYIVPPGWAPSATSYQPGTFLAGVDATRSSVEHISTFTHGVAQVEQLSTTHVRGSFTITTPLANLTDGRFEVPMAVLEELPVICQ